MIVDVANAPSSARAGLHTLHLSAAGGLTQFGAYLETLDPGAWSSRRHWHSAEDEFLYLLSGTATLHDDHGMTDLFPGDAAAWRHGDPNAHHLTNRGDVPCRWLIVGSRAAGDVCTYPDDGRRQVNGETRWQIVAADGTVLNEGDLPPDLSGLRAPWGKPYDGTQRPTILPAGAVKAEVCGSNYPGDWAELGLAEDIALSDAAGLTQFGAFVEILYPGARSSLRHWHEAEDEFLYVLDGTVTLVEDGGPRPIGPGTCVCWPAGVPNGHCLRNDGADPVTLFVAGSRMPEDVCRYPDIDLLYLRQNGQRGFYGKDGTPYPGWPKAVVR
ncbi:cupin domain-containing protein [Tabrizicola piscis]|nr:cupin domain-containing protein [Tabrizicola piscis]